MAESLVEVDGLKLVIRPVTSSDVDVLFKLTYAQGWQVTRDELEMMYVTHTDRLIGAFLQDGTLIAHVSVVDHGTSIGYVGLFVTDPSYGRRGIGTKLLEQIPQIAGERTFTMDSVANTVEYYQRIGCTLTGLENILMSGDMTKRLPNAQDRNHSSPYRVEPVGKDNIDAVTSYDDSIVIEKRTELIKAWIMLKTSIPLCCLDPAGNIVGYIVVRPENTPNVYKLCGLYADDIIAARHLVNVAMTMLPDDVKVVWRVPSNNIVISSSLYSDVLENVQEVKGRINFKLIRGDGKLPNINWDKVFAFTNTYNTFL